MSDININSESQVISLNKSDNKDAGLAPLLLTVLELLRQLMEAQVIRRMDQELLTDEELERAGDSLHQLEKQIVQLCEIFGIDPADLNIDLAEIGTLLPKEGDYYPGKPSEKGSVLELLDRLLDTGIVVDGAVDIGLAKLDLIHARLKLVLTSKPVNS